MTVAFIRIALMNVEYSENKTLMSSSIYANYLSVKLAYSVYNSTQSEDSTSVIIKLNIIPNINAIEKITGVNTKVYFHTASATSLFRSCDDLSSFMKTIVDISSNHNPIKGVEVNHSGFVVRGIYQIFFQ